MLNIVCLFRFAANAPVLEKLLLRLALDPLEALTKELFCECIMVAPSLIWLSLRLGLLIS